MKSTSINIADSHSLCSRFINQEELDTSHARIMIVEDEMIIAMGLACRLEEEGYEIIGLVKNGHDAVTMARCTKPDIIIMDIDLSESTDGIAAAEKIEKHLSVKIIFTSEHTHKDPRIQRILAEGTHSFIQKPYNYERLKELIENRNLTPLLTR
jgi:DNA-binding NarL/FixJ family response regulator